MSSIAPVTQIPAQVRADGPEGRKLWEASLGFESFLVRTLASSMANSIGDAEDEDVDAASATTRDQLPEALADSIARNGGLGLAQQLYASLRHEVIR